MCMKAFQSLGIPPEECLLTHPGSQASSEMLREANWRSLQCSRNCWHFHTKPSSKRLHRISTLGRLSVRQSPNLPPASFRAQAHREHDNRNRGEAISAFKKIGVRSQSALNMNANNTSLLFSFGIVADVQYGDKPSGGLEGRVQNYREAPGKLALAIKDWISKKDAISFVLTLGDVIEGIKGEVEQSLIDLEVVAKILDELAAQTQVHHVVGNHCLRASREALLGRLKIPSNYYSVPIHEADGGGDKWKLVVLDTTEMSLYSRYSEDSVQMTETRAFVEAHPEEEFPCMKIWNGGITTQQKQWLIDQLASSNETGESVIIACHHPVGKGSASELHMAWNAPEIESILCEAPCVKVVLTGHYHPGGYAMIQGKHFVTLEGLLEAPSNSNAFGYVHVFKDRIEIQGEGELSSRVLQMYKGT